VVTLRRKWLTRIALALGALVLVCMGGLYGFSLYRMNQIMSHRVVKLEATPATLGLAGESLALTSSDGIPLKAWWLPAEGARPRGVVVVLHGMDGMDASSLLGHRRFLHDAGYAALVLDMRAHGRSGGTRIGLSLLEPRDVGAALDWLKGPHGPAGVPVALLGISMGGATALRTAAARPDVAAVVSVSGFSSVNDALNDVLAQSGMPKVAVALLTPFMHAALETLYGVWPGRLSTPDDIALIPPRPILIAHGTGDDQISVENAYRLQRAAGGKAQLWIVPGAGHGIWDGDVNAPANAAYRERIVTFLDGALAGAR
jgi:dienelactone hydrolase